MNDDEADFIWKDYDVEQIPFSNLVRRFIMTDEFNKLRKIKQEIKQGFQKTYLQTSNFFFLLNLLIILFTMKKIK